MNPRRELMPLRSAAPAVSAGPKSGNRKQLAWPVAGLLIGFSVVIIHLGRGITIQIGIAAWFAALALVLTLSAHPIGARAAVLLAGLFLAVPCFVWASPLSRCLLMCFMFAPFAAAAALVLTPPIASIRRRLAYLMTWGGTHQVTRRARSFDVASLFQLIVATAVLAAAIAVVKAVPTTGLWSLVRWVAGGILVFAFAEMATACLPLISAGFGLTVPPLMQSPYRSVSVSEFWTKRWNFFASQKFMGPYCFAPLARFGVGFAMSATFVLSGIGHACLAYMALGKWILSLPCGAFFAVQPLLIAAERWLGVRRWPQAAGRTWTLLVLAITSPLIVEPGLQLFERSWGGPDSVLPATVAVLGFVVVFSSTVSLASLTVRPAAMAKPGPSR